MKNTKRTLRRITATLVAMAASASFAAAPLSGARVTIDLPTFSASAADAEILTYKDFSYKVTDNGIVITAYNGSEANPVIPSAIDETAVTAIGSSAFKECTNLTKLEIPSSITEIGKSAFYNCTGLTEIEIPSSVTTIGGSAFAGCIGLEKLTLNEGLTTLGSNCFQNTIISSVNIPSTLTSVDVPSYDPHGPFYNCKSLKNVTFNDKTTMVVGHLFNGCVGLETITIPDTITTIGNSAFYNCTGLTEIEIPSSVTTIGGSAFYNCTALTEIEIPSSVTNIGVDAFCYCTNLEKLTLNEGLKTIGANCFENTKISSVNIPSTLTAVNMPSYDDHGPFTGCKSLKNVTFDNKVTTIINYLFDSCSGLETITIPETITVIGESAFEECTNFTEVEIPSSVTSIDRAAFSKTNLTEIEIPSSVTNIGCDAFCYCTNLEKLTLNEGLKTIGANSFQGTKISSVNIPSTLTSVNMPSYDDHGPFYKSTTLKEVTIADNAAIIPDYLFENCSGLETIDIPYAVRTIGISAFEGCTSLKDITIHNPYCNIYNKNNTISNSATIHGYTPSTAKNYAKSYEREFVSLGSFTLGDVNVDGMVDSSDASMALAEYALIQTGGEPTFTEIQKISADVNKDYSVDSSDASLILAYYADASTGKTPSWN